MLAGLSHAPQYVVRKPRDSEASLVLASDVDSVVLPIDACGGDGAIAFARSLEKNKVHIKIIVVAFHPVITELKEAISPLE